MSGTSEKVDLRVSKTQNALQAALFSLLEKQPFQRITVNDICKTAMVSRATFYMHYEDKYALLRFCLSQSKKDLCLDEADDFRQGLRHMVYTVYKKSKLFKNLLLTESNQELNRMFSEAMVNSVIGKLEEEQQKGREFSVPISILGLFVSGGMAHLLIWWVSEGYPIPPEEMIAHLTTLHEKWSMQEILV